MTPVVLTEKIDLNYHGSFITGSYAAQTKEATMTLQRNAGDDTFNLEASFDNRAFNHQAFSVNNKTFEGANTNTTHKYKAHSSVLNSIKFADAKSIATNFSNGGNFFANLSMFPVITPINKNVVLKENTYLKLRSVDSIQLFLDVSGTDTLVDGKNVGMYAMQHYIDTYIIPKEFDSETGNATMFDIYVSNNGDTSITGDIGLYPGSLTTSGTGSTKIKLNTIPYSGSETFQEAKKVASIDIFDYSYYDYEKKKLELGYGDNSEKGITVPYDFQGVFRRIFDISPNAIFKNLNVMLENKIDSPLLDPYQGKVILHIDDAIEEDHNWRIISSKDFERLKDTDPTLEGLERISYEENI